MPDQQAIQVPGLNTIGPYSKAVRTAGLLFVAGQPGVNASIGEAAGSRFAVQGRAQKCRYHASDRGLDWVANTTVVVTDVLDSSPVRFGKGTTMSVDCSAKASATLNVLSGSKAMQVRVADGKRAGARRRRIFLLEKSECRIE